MKILSNFLLIFIFYFFGFYGEVTAQESTESNSSVPTVPVNTPPISPEATIYYVSNANGSNSNDGKNQSTPFASITKAIQVSKSGDVIYVMSGTYNETLRISKGGTPSGYTTIMAMPGSSQRPQIISNPSIYTPNYPSKGSTISVRASYVRISGLDIAWNYDPATPDIFGQGIGAWGKMSSVDGAPQALVHHIFIDNNVFHDSPGGGIGFSNSDYITLYKNVVFSNARQAPNQTSGISLYGLINSDDLPGYHILIVDNISYGNVNLVDANYKTPDGKTHQSSCTSDGNGIIIDDTQRTQQKDKIPYRGAILILGNLVYNNGGRGIHIFHSDNVTVANNTVYFNMSSQLMCSPSKQGEIESSHSGNVKFFNNIAQSAGVDKSMLITNSTHYLLKNNLLLGNVLIDQKTNDPSLIDSSNILGADPKFVTPSIDPATADFELGTGSPAINAGLPLSTSEEDISGTMAPASSPVNIGAYFTKKK